MFGDTIKMGFSLNKIVGGLSKSLGLINQIIPIYEEAKPIFGKAKNIYSFVKTFNNNSNESSAKETKISTNKPIFFH